MALSKQSPVPSASRVLVELLLTKQLFLPVEGRVVRDGYFAECFGESFGTKEIHEGGSSIHLCTTREMSGYLHLAKLCCVSRRCHTN